MKNTLLLLLALSCFTTSTCIADVNSLIKNSINGDSQAQLELAKYYEQKKYDALMYHWYEKASQNGNIQAQESLANKYFNSGDTEKAISYAQKLSYIGNDVGKSILAYYYCWGAYNVPIDKNLALKLANESSSNPLSKSVLANFYLNGFWNVKKDAAKALELAEESFNEGCNEGGCIYNRISLYNETKDKKNPLRSEIHKKFLEGDYIDGIINASWDIAFSGNKDVNQALKNVEPFIGKSSGYLYYFLSMLELQKNNRAKAIEYLNKSSELWYDSGIFTSLQTCFGRNRYEKNDFIKAKDLISLAMKTKHPDLIAKIYYLFKEADSKNRLSSEGLPDNINWEQIIKEGADNGHPILMLIHAYNLGKDNQDYIKYINQADEMGAVLLIPQCLKNCEDKKKWLQLGVELKDFTCLKSVGIGKLNGSTIINRTKVDFEIDKEKGIDYLKSVAMQGDMNSAYELFNYFSKDIKITNSEFIKNMRKRITLKKDGDNKNEDNNSDKGSNIASKPSNILTEEERKAYEKLKSKLLFTRIINVDKMLKDQEDGNIDIEALKRAYIWGKIYNAHDSKNEKVNCFLSFAQNKFNTDELKELDDNISNLKEEIEITKKGSVENRKKKAEGFMPLDEIEFIVVK